MNRVDQSQGLKSARTKDRQQTDSRVGDIMKASVRRTAALKMVHSYFKPKLTKCKEEPSLNRGCTFYDAFLNVIFG